MHAAHNEGSIGGRESVGSVVKWETEVGKDIEIGKSLLPPSHYEHPKGVFLRPEPKLPPPTVLDSVDRTQGGARNGGVAPYHASPPKARSCPRHQHKVVLNLKKGSGHGITLDGTGIFVSPNLNYERALYPEDGV